METTIENQTVTFEVQVVFKNGHELTTTIEYDYDGYRVYRGNTNFPILDRGNWEYIDLDHNDYSREYFEHEMLLVLETTLECEEINLQATDGTHYFNRADVVRYRIKQVEDGE